MLIKRDIDTGRLEFAARYDLDPTVVIIFFIVTAIVMFFGARFVQKKIKMIWLTLMVLPTIFFMCLLLAMIAFTIYWKVTGVN